MKKYLFLTIALLCAMVFTSCSSDDNDSNIDNLSEKIIGKWMPAEVDGNPVLTDKKSVYTFVSATKAYMSVSINSQQGEATVWNDQKELDVAINGNTMTLTNYSDEHTTMVEEFNITAIDGSEFTANHKITVTVDGNVVLSNEGSIRFVKQTADYGNAIVGTWQGHCTSTGSAFDDGEEHRWQYNADGTYVYYVKDANGQWEPKPANISQYFVDGNLLCTRWQNIGESENREWWEITINGNKMNWTALRENPDRTTFTATFEMTKVE